MSTASAPDPSTDDEEPVVMVVDDEERIPEAFAIWLDDDYEVRSATSGEEALEKMDGDVDVVLLDRHMPGLSGDEVLERIRDADYDCRVAMVTGVDPDFDIVEMEFDDYLTKPVGRDDLRSVVERLLSLDEYDRVVTEYFAASKKRAVLESQKPRSALENSDKYDALLADLEGYERELDALLADLDPEEYETLFYELLDE
ncbi:DNA-binding protein [Halarchaeum grantii]|uniref:DNA-binding protein n=1 Tax=Halarchaeum grantii TaxID=1193105 RepID=A0A830F8Z7_9EURY|nr:response regulator [Halarchaeum grantii]GGL22935.1 DNA-binding protein [Halarchaeum grantii]